MNFGPSNSGRSTPTTTRRCEIQTAETRPCTHKIQPNVRISPKATELPRGSEMTLWASNGSRLYSIISSASGSSRHGGIVLHDHATSFRGKRSGSGVPPVDRHKSASYRWPKSRSHGNCVRNLLRKGPVDGGEPETRLRALRSDLIDPIISVHRGRVVKRTGDGAIVEFRSVVDAVRCAIEVQDGMLERNAGLAPERRIEFRLGIHLGDVVEESDGDLMGDGVNIAARIESLARPGAICLSEDAYRQIKSRLDLAVSDLGERQLKNIAEPIRVYSLEVGKPALVKQAERARPSSHPAPPRLSIVVLPFANLGGDPEQEHFVDGVTESLTTDLSRLSGATVIARNTAFTYKGKHIDVKQIGRDLNIRYVLEGSVQRGGDRLRVNVQLIDAETGAHLWAERFDKPVADLFDMQDEIVARLANTLNAELTALEARRAEQSPNPDSMDHYFQGMAWANKGVTPHNFTKARACFESALALDPGNVDALVGVGMVNSKMVGSGLADDRVARLAPGRARLRQSPAVRDGCECKSTPSRCAPKDDLVRATGPCSGLPRPIGLNGSAQPGDGSGVIGEAKIGLAGQHCPDVKIFVARREPDRLLDVALNLFRSAYGYIRGGEHSASSVR